MKSIHDILSDAFREIKEQHGVALGTVDFNVIRTMAGDAHHGFIEAETFMVPNRGGESEGLARNQGNL